MNRRQHVYEHDDTTVGLQREDKYSFTSTTLARLTGWPTHPEWTYRKPYVLDM